MLFTRCPGCQTTFRLTADMLNMANGHVRCGSCASVFSAYSGLREDLLAESLQGDELLSPTMQSQELAGIEDIDGPDDVAAAPTELAPTDDDDELSEPLVFGAAADALPSAADTPAAIPVADPDSGGTASELDADSPETLTFDAAVDDWAEALAEIQASADDDSPGKMASALEDLPAPGTAPDESDESDDSEAIVPDRWEFDDAESVADAGALHDDVDDGAEPAPDSPENEAAVPMVADDTNADEAWGISDEEIDATLAADPDVELLAAIESRQIGPRVRQVPSKLWGIGCAVLLGLITAQLVHHFRAPLASRSLVGPLVQETYGFLGLEVQPDWDLAQYEILNWSAKAGAGTTTGIGNLQITAQIRNNGPRAQPYPRIRLELKDRWEAIVGSRVFGPGDYLPDDIDLTGRMPVGATVPAGLEIIDPGADASGFELDICLEVDAGGLRCAADRVFQ